MPFELLRNEHIALASDCTTMIIAEHDPSGISRCVRAGEFFLCADNLRAIEERTDNLMISHTPRMDCWGNGRD